MSTEWKQRPEGGGLFAIWLIRNISRYGGRWIGRLLLYPITLYFLIRRGPSARPRGSGWAARWVARPRCGMRPGTSTPSPRPSSTACSCSATAGSTWRSASTWPCGVWMSCMGISTRGRGMLLFGSHLGSFEVLRVLARQRPEYTIRVVLDKAHNPALTQLLDALNPEVAATVIDGGQDGPGLMLAIQEAIAQGALVALLIDRAHPGGQTELAPFFGEDAPFPRRPG